MKPVFKSSLALALSAIAVCIVLPFASASASQVLVAPELVKDIDPSGGSNPTHLTTVGDKLFFKADDGTTGQELWVSDGTATGTNLVKDINPGSDDSLITVYTSIVPFGSGVMFLAKGSDGSEEIWISDGTAAGTTEVSTLNPTNSDMRISSLTPVGSYVLFFYDDLNTGWELWRTDGTTAGTQIVKDINPGSASAIVINSEGLKTFVFNNEMYFVATNGSDGYEFWKSDGTIAGTTMLKDIKAGSDSPFPDPQYWKLAFATVGNTLYFAVNYNNNTFSSYGWELWKTDGTAAGTSRIFASTVESGARAMFLTPAGSNVFFMAYTQATGYELWKSDGTGAGTAMVKDVQLGTNSGMSADRFSSPIFAVGSEVYFEANDGTNGFELWKSDGTGAGTSMVTESLPVPPNGSISRFTLFDSSIYFSVDKDDDEPDELWKLTGATVERVLFEGSAMLRPRNFTVHNNKLFINAQTSQHNRELYVLSASPAPEPEQNQTPAPQAPAVTTTVAPTTTVKAKVKKADTLPATGSSTSALAMFGALLLAGGAIIAARKRVLR